MNDKKTIKYVDLKKYKDDIVVISNANQVYFLGPKSNPTMDEIRNRVEKEKIYIPSALYNTELTEGYTRAKREEYLGMIDSILNTPDKNNEKVEDFDDPLFDVEATATPTNETNDDFMLGNTQQLLGSEYPNNNSSTLELDGLYDQPMNQPMNQPYDQQMNQPMNQPYDQQMNQGFDQPMNQGFDQPMNQGFDQPMNQGFDQPMNQGFDQPMNQGFDQPMNQPYDQGMNQPMNQGTDDFDFDKEFGDLI